MTCRFRRSQWPRPVGLTGTWRSSRKNSELEGTSKGNRLSILSLSGGFCSIFSSTSSRCWVVLGIILEACDKQGVTAAKIRAGGGRDDHWTWRLDGFDVASFSATSSFQLSIDPRMLEHRKQIGDGAMVGHFIPNC